MNDFELLNLIAKGDTENILLQKDLTARLNTLTAKGLVDICGGKILITPKGDQYQKDRRFVLLEDNKIKKEMEEFSQTTLRRNSFYVYICLGLSCTAAILLLLFLLNQL